MLVHSHVWHLSLNDGNTKEADSSYVSLLHLLLSYLAAQQTQADLPLMLRALITNVTIKQGRHYIPFYDSDLGVTQHHLVHDGSSSYKLGQDVRKEGSVSLNWESCFKTSSTLILVLIQSSLLNSIFLGNMREKSD